MRVLSADELIFVSGGAVDPRNQIIPVDPSYDGTNPDIVVNAPHRAPYNFELVAFLNTIASGAGHVAEGAGIVAGYLSISAAAQGGLDAPNDAAAVTAWGVTGAATATKWLFESAATALQ